MAKIYGKVDVENIRVVAAQIAKELLQEGELNGYRSRSRID